MLLYSFASVSLYIDVTLQHHFIIISLHIMLLFSIQNRFVRMSNWNDIIITFSTVFFSFFHHIRCKYFWCSYSYYQYQYIRCINCCLLQQDPWSDHSHINCINQTRLATSWPVRIIYGHVILKLWFTNFPNCTLSSLPKGYSADLWIHPYIFCFAVQTAC